MNEELIEKDKNKRALTESFIIDGEIAESTDRSSAKQRPRKKKKKKVKKPSSNDLDELEIRNDSLSQSLLEIREQSILENTAQKEGKEISDSSSEFS